MGCIGACAAADSEAHSGSSRLLGASATHTGLPADRFLIAEACIKCAEECRDDRVMPRFLELVKVCRSADATACASLALAVGLERASNDVPARVHAWQESGPSPKACVPAVATFCRVRTTSSALISTIAKRMRVRSVNHEAAFQEEMKEARREARETSRLR